MSSIRYKFAYMTIENSDQPEWSLIRVFNMRSTSQGSNVCLGGNLDRQDCLEVVMGSQSVSYYYSWSVLDAQTHLQTNPTLNSDVAYVKYVISGDGAMFLPKGHNLNKLDTEKVSEFDQEIPQSHTADQPMAS